MCSIIRGVHLVLAPEGEDNASLAQQVQEALTAADFQRAVEANEQLLALARGPHARLFAQCARLQAAALQRRQLELEPILRDLERSHACADRSTPLPEYWYTLAWLTAPFVADHPVDIFYLHHLALHLAETVLRQECLARAAHYGTRYRDHYFMAHFLEANPSGPQDGDPYHRAETEYIVAAYRHDSERLARAGLDLKRSAATPLQQYTADQLVRTYEHLAIA